MAKAAVKELVAQEGDNALAAAYGGNIPTGFEADRADDFVIPFFTILQGLSPQMETVEGAKLGYIINTNSNELFANGINLAVAKKVIKYVEWLPNRGGLAAVHEPDSEFVAKVKKACGAEEDKFAKLVTEAGNSLNETKYIYGVLANDEKRPMGFGCIGFSVTKIKKYNAWNTDARNKLGEFGRPLHSLVWHFGSFKDKNAKGEFYNWNHSLFGGNINAATIHPVNDKPLFDAVGSLLGRADVKLDIAAERSTEADEGAM